MKMCQPHWDQIREAIRVRGLSHLGASSGIEALERLNDELAGRATPDTYDPLMDANNMIWSKALEFGGLYLMGQKDDGSQYCPLCEVDIHTPAREDGRPEAQHWIEGCTDTILRHCREISLVSSVS